MKCIYFNSILRKLLPSKVLLKLKKLYYPIRLRSLSESEYPVFSIINQLVKPGDVVVDVGANLGVISILLSRLVGNDGKVYSMEPIPLTFDILKNNVKKLDLSNIQIFNIGVSDNDGFKEMKVPKYDSGGENFYEARIVEGDIANKGLRRLSVEVRKLDTILADLTEPIAFVKIDVEGHMLQVIEGASTLIKKTHPPFYIEVSGDPDDERSNAETLFSILIKEGYDAYLFDGKRLRERLKGDQSVNYFFLTKDQFEKIQGS